MTKDIRKSLTNLEGAMINGDVNILEIEDLEDIFAYILELQTKLAKEK